MNIKLCLLTFTGIVFAIGNIAYAGDGSPEMGTNSDYTISESDRAAAMQVFMIVIALAVGHILAFIGQAIRHRDDVKIYWTQILWAAPVILLLVADAFNEQRRGDIDTMPELFISMIPTSSIFIASYVLFPTISGRMKYDSLKDYYLSNQRWAFILLSLYPATWLCSSLILAWIRGEPEFGSAELNTIRAIGTGLCVFLAFWKGTKAHFASALIAILVILTFIGVRGDLQSPPPENDPNNEMLDNVEPVGLGPSSQLGLWTNRPTQ